MLGQRRGHLPLRSARPKTRPCCRPRVAAFAIFLAALWLLVMFNLRRLNAMKAAVRGRQQSSGAAAGGVIASRRRTAEEPSG